MFDGISIQYYLNLQESSISIYLKWEAKKKDNTLYYNFSNEHTH